VVFAVLVMPSLASAALTDGLISVWNFDDESANDALGRNDGILRGGAAFSDGQSGKAVDLNGVDAFVEVPHSDSMNGLENAFSVSAWAFFPGARQFRWHCLEGKASWLGSRIHV
jgi:hypothetical protein